MLLHHGMVIVGLLDSFQGQLRLDEVTGGTPNGASTIAAGDGSRQLSQNELAANASRAGTCRRSRAERWTRAGRCTRMMNARPALLIANDKSRRGGEIAPFVAALERGGLTVRREPCQDPAELPGVIKALRSEISCVILGGGDGTMHAGAPALVESGLTLGVLPLGTANDLARSLGIPNEAEGAAATILAGRTRVIDLGTVNGVPFFNVASLGLSVDITKRLNRIMKRRLGMLAYPLAAALTVATTGRFRASLRVDGEEILVHTLQVAVGNGRFYGGGTVIDESAEIDDGVLHGYSLEPRARWRLIMLAPAFRAGAHRELREVRNFTCRSLTVTTKRAREVTADGEIVTRTPAHFGLLPGAVTVFVP